MTPEFLVPYTRPLLPDFTSVTESLRTVWESGVVANRGAKEVEFEQALQNRFGWSNVVLSSSCTLAMYLLLAASEVDGEVLVSSFTHPATLQAVRLAGLRPVTVDIDPIDLTIDVEALEASIGPRTSCILATHIFGHPCDVEQLASIAERRGLLLLFDGASAVGVEYDGQPISSYGHGVSFSFHATKLLTTVEGGAAVCRRTGMSDVMRKLRNFGISESKMADRRGLNAKLHEVSAAIGTLALRTLDQEILKRRNISSDYSSLLRTLDGVQIVEPRAVMESNFSCAPKRLERHLAGNGGAALVADRMRDRGVDARRYFCEHYQHIDSDEAGTHARAQAARRDILCLPIFGDMTRDQIYTVVDALRLALQ